MKKATLAAGCFWGVEVAFSKLKGVTKVTVGYEGGHTKNPTYKEVCTNTTGHAEVVQVKYDITIISYEQLLQTFWEIHDPTTLNKQGPDVGTQYRSIIFYHDKEQQVAAEASKKTVQKKWQRPIVTQIIPAETFYPAEEYHQQFFKKNGMPSCHLTT